MGELSLLRKEYINFAQTNDEESFAEKLEYAFNVLAETVGNINSERIRIYATGIFQHYEAKEKNSIVIDVFVDYGVYFNIVDPELEEFYIKKSLSITGCGNMMEGIIQQEFRKVVICGSFQQHLDEIGNVMASLQQRNVEVLSPWTTKIVPETIGTDFILLEGQSPLKNNRDAWRHEHMEKFQKSDARGISRMRWCMILK